MQSFTFINTLKVALAKITEKRVTKNQILMLTVKGSCFLILNLKEINLPENWLLQNL